MTERFSRGDRVRFGDDLPAPEPKHVGQIGEIIRQHPVAEDLTHDWVKWPDGSEVGYPVGSLVLASPKPEKPTTIRASRNPPPGSKK
jgi:hypothetical protein